MGERVARRRAQTRERIFLQAMRLFAERGFDGVTVADIAEAADVAKGTFFTHFQTKRDVFRYLGEQAVNEMIAAIPAEGSTRERVTRMLLAAADWLTDRPALAHQMVLSRNVNFSLDVGSVNQVRFGQALSELLTEGVRKGELRPDLSIPDAVALLQGAHYLSVVSWGLDPEGRALQDRLCTALDILFEGMA